MRGRHSCGSRSVVVFKATGLMVIPLRCGRVQGPDACPICRAKRRNRILGEVWSHRDEGVYLRICNVHEAQLATVRLRRTEGAWYLKLPQNDGTQVLVANNNEKLSGGVPLPTDDGQLKEVISKLLDTPNGSRISHRRARHLEAEALPERVRSYVVDCTPQVLKTYAEEAGAVLNWQAHEATFFNAEPKVQAACIAHLARRGVRVAERVQPTV